LIHAVGLKRENRKKSIAAPHVLENVKVKAGKISSIMRTNHSKAVECK
jgi:hypothetical protein